MTLLRRRRERWPPRSDRCRLRCRHPLSGRYRRGEQVACLARSLWVPLPGATPSWRSSPASTPCRGRGRSKGPAVMVPAWPVDRGTWIPRCPCTRCVPTAVAMRNHLHVNAGNDERRQQAADLATTTQRALAGLVGIAAGVGGTLAMYETTNELGTAALFIVAGVFLLCATFGVVPTRVRVGNSEVSVGRAALHTLEQIVSESDLPTQEKVIDTLEANLARGGITRSDDEAVAAMLDRFVRYSGSDSARHLHDELLAAGWSPSTPAKSTYIRWTYSGTRQQASLFQNSAQLVVASNRLVEVVRDFPGADLRLPKNEVVFSYPVSIDSATAAADAIRRYADGAESIS